ncbi:hypothetical protein HY086_04010 [Candidatus Gottesmanbacteria bacterium]|nr:hypothetical protein [Candidatus Gottesmanbacteria bacterium]
MSLQKIFFSLGLLVIAFTLVFRTHAHPLKKATAEVLALCKSAGYRPSCYEKEIPKLLGKLTMEQTFAVVKGVQDADPEYLYCHVLAHKISFAESQKHPDQWKDILSRCPQAQCNYGCLHGSLIQHFRGETLTDTQIVEAIPDLSTVCEPHAGFSPTDLDRTMCYHALGHLAMYITGGKPGKAIPICEQVSKKPDGRNYTDTCIQGIFMTVFQGVDPEDIALVKGIKPEKNAVVAFCSYYEKHWQSCRRESYPLFRDQILTPDGFIGFCSYALDSAHWENCALGVLNIVADTFFEKTDGLEKSKAYCSRLPKDKQSICYAGIAQRLVQIEPLRHIDTAVSLCVEAQRYGLDKDCFEGLSYYGFVSFLPHTPDQSVYCQKIPVVWQCGLYGRHSP